jgi:hypothetical protein
MVYSTDAPWPSPEQNNSGDGESHEEHDNADGYDICTYPYHMNEPFPTGEISIFGDSYCPTPEDLFFDSALGAMSMSSDPQAYANTLTYDDGGHASYSFQDESGCSITLGSTSIPSASQLSSNIPFDDDGDACYPDLEDLFFDFIPGDAAIPSNSQSPSTVSSIDVQYSVL